MIEIRFRHPSFCLSRGRLTVWVGHFHHGLRGVLGEYLQYLRPWMDSTQTLRWRRATPLVRSCRTWPRTPTRPGLEAKKCGRHVSNNSEFDPWIWWNHDEDDNLEARWWLFRLQIWAFPNKDTIAGEFCLFSSVKGMTLQGSLWPHCSLFLHHASVWQESLCHKPCEAIIPIPKPEKRVRSRAITSEEMGDLLRWEDFTSKLSIGFEFQLKLRWFDVICPSSVHPLDTCITGLCDIVVELVRSWSHLENSPSTWFAINSLLSSISLYHSKHYYWNLLMCWTGSRCASTVNSRGSCDRCNLKVSADGLKSGPRLVTELCLDALHAIG